MIRKFYGEQSQSRATFWWNLSLCCCGDYRSNAPEKMFVCKDVQKFCLILMSGIQPDAAPDALSNGENPTSIAINGEELFKKWWLAF